MKPQRFIRALTKQERQDIEKLFGLARDLASLLYREAIELGSRTKEYYQSEASTLIEIAIAKVAHCDEGPMRAKALAESQAQTRITAEALAKGMMKAAEIEHKAASNILSRMNQEISYLKEEKNREFRTGNFENELIERVKVLERKMNDLRN